MHQHKYCLRAPVPEISTAARLLDLAVSAHQDGNVERAAALIEQANFKEIREWTESLWGTHSPHVQARVSPSQPPHQPKGLRPPVRMPDLADRVRLIARDGLHCRFCDIPLIRREVRERIRKFYPNIWGRSNRDQHAAFQAMWLQYDHVVPYARGGDNSFANMVIACAPCNYARMDLTLEEVGLYDPRSRAPVRSQWDGLERFPSA